MFLDRKLLSENRESLAPLLRSQVSVPPPRQRTSHAVAGLTTRLSSLSPEQLRPELLRLVRQQVAGVLALSSPESVQESAVLKTLGLDSLMAVELRNRLSKATGLSLAATLVFDFPTPEQLADHLAALCMTQSSTRPVVTARLPSAAPNEPIAIIGMGCRLPGGIRSPADFWTVLSEAKDVIEGFPQERWDVEALYDEDPEARGKSYCRQGGFLHNLDRFDAAFFGIAPREAQSMDPQQRLMLETVWQALEDAGVPAGQLAQSRTGIFVGAMASDYWGRGGDATALQALDGYVATGSHGSVLSGRIAYTLNLQGPAITVDTACSSSLVALHLGCQSLRTGECDWAFVGGVTVMNTPAAFVEFSRIRGLARDGRCKSFSAQADGAGWAEGCAVLLLKRLSDAQREGLPILALVRGSAVNQDGRSQGLTAPNAPAQERVIRAALTQCGLSPADIDGVEAHGTGTRLGDPIEANALSAVFSTERPAMRPLLLGSAKSNLGHTQAAAGVVGILKVVLALQNECLPQSLHAHELSPYVDWEHSGLRVLQQAEAWPRGTRRRRAGVSSFGISGTNAHVIVEEA
ncbi:MAG TPA: type I polyketide synthase, partial [Pseudomonadota bacterium]|nr:type I polyketide synthase [Pseudomonadota bacterium]